MTKGFWSCGSAGARGAVAAMLLGLAAQSALAEDAPATTPTAVPQDSQIRTLLDAWKHLDAPRQPAISLPARRPLDSFRYTSPFGVRTDPFRGVTAQHNGVDLAAPTGTPVHATADGMVTEAGAASGYGNLIQLDHGAGVQTRYGHLSRILVARGQRVLKGDVIGLVGSTGRSTGSHLHYEVRVAERAINPLPYMAVGDEQLALRQSVGPQPGAATAMGGPRNDGRGEAPVGRR